MDEPKVKFKLLSQSRLKTVPQRLFVFSPSRAGNSACLTAIQVPFTVISSPAFCVCLFTSVLCTSNVLYVECNSQCCDAHTPACKRQALIVLITEINSFMFLSFSMLKSEVLTNTKQTTKRRTWPPRPSVAVWWVVASRIEPRRPSYFHRLLLLILLREVNFTSSWCHCLTAYIYSFRNGSVHLPESP